jgi:2-methylcitrate dehydratase PrpD
MIGVVCEPREKKVAPQNDWQGRASLQYSMAEALVTGRLDGQSYRSTGNTRAEIRTLAQKVEYEVDKTAKPGQFKGWVIVETLDGRQLERVAPYNRGSAELPLSEADILKKFRDNSALLFKESPLSAIEAAVDSLSGAGALRRLAALCVARA